MPSDQTFWGALAGVVMAMMGIAGAWLKLRPREPRNHRVVEVKLCEADRMCIRELKEAQLDSNREIKAMRGELQQMWRELIRR